MSLSRWKLMAGVLGVSLGGLAAVAGPCPKTDENKSASAEAPVIPAMPPNGSAPKIPAAPPSPAIPAPAVDLPPPAPSSELPQLPGTPSAPPALPLIPPSGDASKKPEAVSRPSMPPVIPASGTAVPPPLPTGPDVVPGKPSLPTAPPVGVEFTKPPKPPELVSPLAGKPSPSLTPPAATPDGPGSKPLPGPAIGSVLPPDVARPPSTGGPPLPPPVAGPSDPFIADPPSATFVKPPTASVPTTTTPHAGATKYRIVLRVGEGDPTFEVRSGDDLVLKVVCEKVDVKSPEKGQGLSAVKASGKVRFAGFGAEGTCDELAFLAGTGEVGMTGNVRIQVKDKLGRIESELSTENMRYRIDSSAISGSMKP